VAAPPAAETRASPTPAALPYFIMEFVDGVNLRQLQKAGRLSPREALQIVPQICDALQYAHDEGVVHRDIKPENVLVDRKGRVKIADFGLAKIMRGRAGSPLPFDDSEETGAPGTARPTTPTHLTEVGQVMGTPHYMAPEQIEHPQDVDHRADIYSLGVVFYEMLTGELPLGKFQPPSRKVQVDVRLDEVVLHALEKQPERRYQQASQLSTDVQGITAAPTGAIEPTSSGLRAWKIAAAVILALVAVNFAVVVVAFRPALSKPRPTFEKGKAASVESTSKAGDMLEKEVTIDLKNVPLEAALTQLNKIAGVKIVAGKPLPALKQRLNVPLRRVKLGDLFSYLSENYDLEFQVRSNLVLVIEGKAQEKAAEETRFYRLHNSGNDLATALASLERAITNLFKGSYNMIDHNRNLVVARGTPEQLGVMETILREWGAAPHTEWESPVLSNSPVAASPPPRLVASQSSAAASPALFQFRWVAADGDTHAPADEFVSTDGHGRQTQLRVLKDILMDGSAVASAGLPVSRSGETEILVALTTDGGRKFARLTAANIGRQLAIIWRGRILSAPVIRSAITSGELPISGNLTDAESEELLEALNHREPSATPPNSNSTPQVLAAARAQLTEPPALRFLAWQDEWQTNQLGAARHPDGSRVTDPIELGWLRQISPGRSGISGNKPKSEPRFLHLWFSYPPVGRTELNEVSLLDGVGKPILAGGRNSWFSQPHDPNDRNSNLGWFTATLSEWDWTNLSSHVTVQLTYTVGPLERVQELAITPNRAISIFLGGGGSLNNYGQNMDGTAFLTMTADVVGNSGRRFDAIAVTKEGREIPSKVRGSSAWLGTHGMRRFEFTLPLADVAKFRIGTRPVRTNEWRDVVLPGN
jgi:serine/threonine protein kinase